MIIDFLNGRSFDITQFIFAFPFQLLGAEFLLLYSRKMRSHAWIRIVGVVLFFTLFVLFVPQFVGAIWQVVLFFAFQFFLTYGGMILIYRESPWEILFCCTAAYCIQNTASNLSEIVHNYESQIGSNYFWVYPLCQALSLALCYVLAYFILSRKIRDEEVINIDNKQVILLSLLALTLVIVLSWVVGNIGSGTIQNVACKCLMILANILILTVQFGLLNQSKLQNDLNMIQQMWKKDQEHYKISKANMEMLNIKLHDLKHISQTFDGTKNAEFAASMKDALEMYDLMLDTGNKALDVLVMEKGIYCQKHNIKLSCVCDGAKLSGFKDVDIYSLFGNTLDNAIESVMKLKDKSKRVISMTVRSEKGFLVVHIENYYSGKITFRNGLPQTTKADKKNHGFGVKSIALLVGKYGGEVSMSTDEDIFIQNFVFPLNEEGLVSSVA